MKAVRNYPTPKNVKDVRANLGIASFYRRLIHFYLPHQLHVDIELNLNIIHYFPTTES